MTHNVLYYKVEGDTLYYNAEQLSDAWVQYNFYTNSGTLPNKTGIKKVKKFAPLGSQFVQITATGINNKFFADFPDVEEIDASGITIDKMTGYLGSYVYSVTNPFQNNPKLSHLILANGELCNISGNGGNVGLIDNSANVNELIIEGEVFSTYGLRAPFRNALCKKLNTDNIIFTGTGDVKLMELFNNMPVTEEVSFRFMDNNTEANYIQSGQAAERRHIYNCPKLNHLLLPQLKPINWDLSIKDSITLNELFVEGTVPTDCNSYFENICNHTVNASFNLRSIDSITSCNHMFSYIRCDTFDISNLKFNTRFGSNNYLFIADGVKTVKLPANIGITVPDNGSCIIKGSNKTNYNELIVYADFTNSPNGMQGFTRDLNYNILDLSNVIYPISPSNINNAFYNFLGTTIYSTDLYKSGVTTSYSEVFTNAKKLVGGKGTAFSDKSGTHAIIDNGTNGGYFTAPRDPVNVVVTPSGAADVKVRKDRNEYTFDVTINKNSKGHYYIFNYFRYATPSGEWSHDIRKLSQCTIPITEEGYYDCIFFFIDPDKQNQYEGGGNSEDRDPGGSGGFEDIDDKVNAEALPTISTLGGFSTAYNLDETSLNNLAYLCYVSGVPSPETLKNYIVSLHMIPANLPLSTNEVVVYLGNTKMEGNQGAFPVKAHTIERQFINVDCGKMLINKYWNGYLDYSPYTKLTIYLPYIGYRQLNADYYMGKHLGVIYSIDIYTGECIAKITANNVILDTFNGNCSVPIQVSADDHNSKILSSSISSVLSIGVGALGSIVSETPIPLAGAVASSANAMMGSKNTSPHNAGNLNGTLGIMNNQKPYLIIEKPNQSVPKNYAEEMGFPVNISGKLNEFRGFTVLEKIDVHNVNCTDAEKAELERLLKEGVIL